VQITTPAAVRANNLSITLNLIRERGSITRTELMELTELSAPTISSLVNFLISAGFVEEKGSAASSGGRRPNLLHFNYDARHAVGVDMGATHVNVVCMNLAGQVKSHQSRRMDIVNLPRQTLDNIIEMVHEVITESQVPMDEILGLGLTVPAPLNTITSGTFLTHYMPSWKGISPIQELGKVFSMPLYLENDANAGALAEKWWGSARKCDTIVFVKLGTGVGSGLIIGNEIYRGFSGTAGEIGHTTIETMGRRCRCGNQGCMESYVGLPGILMDARLGLAEDASWVGSLDNLTVQQVIEAARRGNQFCQQLIQTAGRYLGIGLANLVNIMNPGMLVLGGELAEAGDFLVEPMVTSMLNRSIPFEKHMEKIVMSELGQDAVAIGAATLAIIEAFSPSNLYRTLHRMDDPILKGGEAIQKEG
jgi:glucokinase-like ROK family protein